MTRQILPLLLLLNFPCVDVIYDSNEKTEAIISYDYAEPVEKNCDDEKIIEVYDAYEESVKLSEDVNKKILELVEYASF